MTVGLLLLSTVGYWFWKSYLYTKDDPRHKQKSCLLRLTIIDIAAILFAALNLWIITNCFIEFL